MAYKMHRSVEDLKTSVRNTEYSRGVISKPSGILNLIDDCSDNCEATIELLTLYIVTRLKGIIPIFTRLKRAGNRPLFSFDISLIYPYIILPSSPYTHLIVGNRILTPPL